MPTIVLPIPKVPAPSPTPTTVFNVFPVPIELPQAIRMKDKNSFCPLPSSDNFSTDFPMHGKTKNTHRRRICPYPEKAIRTKYEERSHIHTFVYFQTGENAVDAKSTEQYKRWKDDVEVSKGRKSRFEIVPIGKFGDFEFNTRDIKFLSQGRIYRDWEEFTEGLRMFSACFYRIYEIRDRYKVTCSGGSAPRKTRYSRF